MKSVKQAAVIVFLLSQALFRPVSRRPTKKRVRQRGEGPSRNQARAPGGMDAADFREGRGQGRGHLDASVLAQGMA